MRLTPSKCQTVIQWSADPASSCTQWDIKWCLITDTYPVLLPCGGIQWYPVLGDGGIWSMLGKDTKPSPLMSGRVCVSHVLRFYGKSSPTTLADLMSVNFLIRCDGRKDVPLTYSARKTEFIIGRLYADKLTWKNYYIMRFSKQLFTLFHQKLGAECLVSS